MDLSFVSQALLTMLSYAYYIFIHGGWVLMVIIVIRMVFLLYMNKIIGDFLSSTEWVNLHVKVSRENLVSTRAVDAFFSQMHAVHSGFTWAQTYLEGQVNLWISFEIVSIGGKISFIIRTPKKYRHLLESSLYAQYPSAEISEVEDYMAHLSHWTPEASWDLWGTEYLQLKDFAYPIRTYRDFEHPTAEEKIIDPLAGLFEALAKFEEHELFAVQIVCRPIADKEWQPHSAEVVKALKGEEEHYETFFDILLKPLNILSKKTAFEAIREPKAVSHDDEQKNVAPIMRLTEGERRIISSIEEKASKVGYEVKIRNLYIAPKDKFDTTKRTAIIGAFRAMGGVSTNDFKPDVSHTWTNHNYKVFKNLEKPYTDYMIALKKHHMLEGFVSRSMWIGANPMILNSEELATIYHFPIAVGAPVAPVEAIDVKKGAPPANLPII